MSRWKKYIKEKGYKFECDFPMIPYDIGPQTILGIYSGIYRDGVYITTIYSSVVASCIFDRNGHEEHTDDIVLKK